MADDPDIFGERRPRLARGLLWIVVGILVVLQCIAIVALLYVLAQPN